MGENKFVKKLQEDVIDFKGENKLKKELEILEEKLKLEEGAVIKDPKTLEKLKKEIEKVKKEIDKEKTLKAVEKGDVVLDENAKKDTDKTVKDEENKEELNNKNKVNEDTKNKEEKEKLKQEYYDSMMRLHNQRMKTIQKQKSYNKLVSSNEEFEFELKLEEKLYKSRDEYLKEFKSDPYAKKRSELNKKEEETIKPIKLELAKRTERFRKIEEEIREIDKQEEEINDKLLKQDINEFQTKKLEEDFKELVEKRNKLELELSDIKDNLDNIIDIGRERLNKRRLLDRKNMETLSYEDKRNDEYRKKNRDIMYNNYDKATKQHYDNLKTRIEEREDKIKKINQQLDDIPKEDLEKRLALLNELDKETNMLKADRETKSCLDRGIVLDGQEMLDDTKEKYDTEEYRQEVFDDKTEEVYNIAKEQEKSTDEKCVIPGLEKMVRDPNNISDAKAILENDEQIKKAEEIKEADEKLKEIQENIEDKM